MISGYGGQIKDFPPEVVELMLQRQYEQQGHSNIEEFEDRRSAGFTWDKSPEGHEFWSDVILHKKFKVFFKKYLIIKSSPKEIELFLKRYSL